MSKDKVKELSKSGPVKVENGLRIYEYDSEEHKSFAELEPGVYKLGARSKGFLSSGFILELTEMPIVSDKILPLPSKEFKQVRNQINEFLKPEIRKKYKSLGFVYKRSVLLYGEPGTGKTCLINQLCKDIVKNDGIVLWAEHPGYAKALDKFFHFNNKESFVALIMEEFDTIIQNTESAALTLLDGQVQRDNTMFLCTTNYINKTPARILRPVRINIKMKIDFPDEEVRKYYLYNFLQDESLINEIVSKKVDK